MAPVGVLLPCHGVVLKDIPGLTPGGSGPISLAALELPWKGLGLSDSQPALGCKATLV